jgi:hypothetical protein
MQTYFLNLVMPYTDSVTSNRYRVTCSPYPSLRHPDDDPDSDDPNIEITLYDGTREQCEALINNLYAAMPSAFDNPRYGHHAG